MIIKSIFIKTIYRHMSSIKEFDNLPIGELAERIQSEAKDVKHYLEAMLSAEAIRPFNDHYWKVLLFAQRVKNELT